MSLYLCKWNSNLANSIWPVLLAFRRGRGHTPYWCQHTCSPGVGGCPGSTTPQTAVTLEERSAETRCPCKYCSSFSLRHREASGLAKTKAFSKSCSWASSSNLSEMRISSITLIQRKPHQGLQKCSCLPQPEMDQFLAIKNLLKEW